MRIKLGTRGLHKVLQDKTIKGANGYGCIQFDLDPYPCRLRIRI